MNRTIAITGATGFAGRHAADELLKRGYSLKALVRRPEAAGLPAAVETVKGDVSDEGALARLVDGADAVVHLAGAITALDRSGYFAVNEGGTAALMRAAAEAGTPRVVHISSLAAREPQLSSYAASKRAGEEAATQILGGRALIIRPPAVYGPGDKGTLPLMRELTKPVAAIPGRRDARFSLIHVRDLARIIAEALAGGEQGVHEVSDGRRNGYGWHDLAAVAAEVRGAPVRALFLPRPVPALVARASEAVSRLTGKPGMVNSGKIAELYHSDWVARTGSLALADPISFGDGFRETLEWYRAAGWLPRPRALDRRPANP